MSGVVVVGGGMSGAACARVLADAGVDVRVVDRGRRAGGRTAARTFRDLPGGDHPTDTGAPYCTASDDGFRAVLDRWAGRGLVREWTDTFVTAGPEGIGEPKPGPMRYAGTGSMRALAEDLLDGVEVRHGQAVDADGLESLAAGSRAVVLAMPGPQAARLLAGRPDLARVADQPYDPAIAVVARFAERTWPEFDAAFVSDLPIRWLADDGRSRGDGAPVLVAHTTPDVARPRLDDPGSVVGPVLDAVRTVLGIDDEPAETLVQRWTYSQPAEGRDATFHLADDGVGPCSIGLCSDGWAPRSRVESAWRSGTDLGTALLTRLA